MQGPFDQQTDNAGFYMPLLGATPPHNFARSLFARAAGQRADTLGPALSKAVAEARFEPADVFPGHTRRGFTTKFLGGNRIIATLFSIFGAVAFRSVGRRVSTA